MEIKQLKKNKKKVQIKLYLNAIVVARYKSIEQEIAIKNVETLYEEREKVIELFY